MLLPSLLSFIFLADLACALRLEIEGRHVPATERSILSRRSNLASRATLAGSSPLGDSADLQYTTNITIQGQSFQVLIDTGSSDLWVAANSLSGTTTTGKAGTISYASGGATGDILTGTLGFAGSTVSGQAFISVNPDSSHPVGQGLVGLGPSSGSVIFGSFDSASEGNTVLDNIFTQNTSTPNFITFTLGRLDDPSQSFPGSLTVGEVLSNYTNVTSQPKLTVTEVAISNDANQHFQVLLDANGFIGPDGNPISITSEVGSTSNKKQATVVIDSGFSLPQVPSAVAQAIYSQFSGAELYDDPSLGSVWLVPCTQEVNITLKFSGVSIPVHPLDATADPKIFGMSARKTSSGQNACIGMFQPVSFDKGSSPTYDIIFGMAFLRNVYTLVNFGDFVAGSSTKADPYIQFLSITDPADAHKDFVDQRLNGVDSTVNIFNVHNTNDDDSSGLHLSRTTVIIIAASAGGAALLLVFLGLFCRRRRQNRATAYRPLHLPAPGQSATMYGGAPPPMYQQGPPGYAYNPSAVGYNPEQAYDPPVQTSERVPYHNPWEARQH
ncbi:aspartic peptidase domain-containing protein [Roridomyces roridus]|uniref:Aspartic peptidase domain-containing protein n=1 Tax=Roridomyces roridus TaxID=1738132 RepID=A0AAD7FWW9_9AGAR|nr:aspartic peptidase domain-containing protein [Roridomyces roridus]